MIGQNAGQPAAGKRAGIEKHNHEIGQVAANAMLNGIRRDIFEADKEAPFDEEYTGGHEKHGQAQEHAQVGEETLARRAGHARKHIPSAHRNAPGKKKHDGNQANHSRRPRKAQPSTEMVEDEREDDAAEAAARHGQASSRAAPPAKVLADGGDGHDKDDRRGHAGDDADDDDKVPVQAAVAERDVGGDVEQQAADHEPRRAVGVKDGANLQPAEEDHEVVEAKDPGLAALALGGELVAADPGLVHADAVHEPQAAHERAEAAEEHRVGGAPALGVRGDVGLLLGGRKDGTGLAQPILELGIVGVDGRRLFRLGLPAG